MAGESKAKIIAVASQQPDSGKTTISVNLAVALAQMLNERDPEGAPLSRSRVLLVDPTNSYRYRRGAISYLHADPIVAQVKRAGLLAQDIILDERASIYRADNLEDALDVMRHREFVIIDTSSYDDRTRLEVLKIADSIIIPLDSTGNPLEALCKTIDISQLASTDTSSIKLEAIVKNKHVPRAEVWGDVDSFISKTFGKHGPAVNTVEYNNQIVKATDTSSIATGWISDIAKHDFTALAATVLNARRRRPFLESVETRNYLARNSSPVEVALPVDDTTDLNSQIFHGFDDVDFDDISFDFSTSDDERRITGGRLKREFAELVTYDTKTDTNKPDTPAPSQIPEQLSVQQVDKRVDASDDFEKPINVSSIDSIVNADSYTPSDIKHQSRLSAITDLFTQAKRFAVYAVAAAAIAVTVTLPSYLQRPENDAAKELKTSMFAFHDAENAMSDSEGVKFMAAEDLIQAVDSKPRRRKMIVTGNFSDAPSSGIYLDRGIDGLARALFHGDSFAHTSGYDSVRRVTSYGVGGAGEPVTQLKQHRAEDYAPNDGLQGHPLYPVADGGIITHMWQPFSTTCGNGIEIQLTPTIFMSGCHLQAGTPFTDYAIEHLSAKKEWVNRFKTRHGRSPQFDEFPKSLRLSASKAVAYIGNTGHVVPAPTRSSPNRGTHLHLNLLMRDGKKAAKLTHNQFTDRMNREIARRYMKK